jgi:hypothetical protein
MNNKLNKDLIRSVLNELLLLKDGDLMPNNSGVCKELFVASVKKNGIESHHPTGCPEYVWANNIADGDYVDTYGMMTAIRREFIYKLLILLKDEDE